MVDINSILQTIAVTFGFLIGSIVISEILLFILDKVIKPLTAKTKTTLDDRVIEAIKSPVRLLGVIIGIYLTLKPIYGGEAFFGRGLEFWLITSLILLGGMLVSNLINAVIMWYYQEVSEENKQKSGINISRDFIPMLKRIVKVAVYSVTLIVILNRFGIEVTPLITALGIGGLAVALAIKDTLANFFAGIYLLTDKPIKIGDFIALDNENSAVRGFVEEVGWRTTRIRTRGNFTYYIPNEKITLNSVVNFSRGRDDNWKGASILVGTEYGTDIEKTKKAIMAGALKAQKNSSVISKQVKPFMQLVDFGKGAIVFRLLYRINNYFDTETAASEMREAIIAEFDRAKIKMMPPA